MEWLETIARPGMNPFRLLTNQLANDLLATQRGSLPDVQPSILRQQHFEDWFLAVVAGQHHERDAVLVSGISKRIILRYEPSKLVDLAGFNCLDCLRGRVHGIPNVVEIKLF